MIPGPASAVTVRQLAAQLASVNVVRCLEDQPGKKQREEELLA